MKVSPRCGDVRVVRGFVLTVDYFRDLVILALHKFTLNLNEFFCRVLVEIGKV